MLTAPARRGTRNPLESGLMVQVYVEPCQQDLRRSAGRGLVFVQPASIGGRRLYYRVEITSKTPTWNGRRLESISDLSMEDLDARYLDPYRKGQSIVIDGRIITGDDLERVKIFESERPAGHLSSIPDGMMRDVTSNFITGPPGSLVDPNVPPDQEFRPAANAREVFVVHGKNLDAKDAIFQFLRAIGLDPLEWSVAVQSTGRPSPYIGEILEVAFSRAQAVLVLFTPDDEARLKEEFRQASDPVHETQLTGQARANVLFEAGMAMGRSEDRTVLVEVGILRPFSDVGGRHVIRLNNSTQRRQELAQRLRAAGCPVNLDGTDWHDTGDFDAAVQDVVPANTEVTTVNSEHHDGHESGVSEDAKELLVEAAKDVGRHRGVITRTSTMGGTYIQTHGISWGEPDDRRSIARWEAAIRELIDLGYVEDPSGQDSFFQVTYPGFQFVEAIEAELGHTGELN